MSNRPIGTLTLVAALALNIALVPALAAAETIAPRFYDSDAPVYKRSKDKLEITTKYQDTAFAMANMYKGMIEQAKHKGSFHTDKHTFYIDDLTAKKSFVVTSRFTVRKKTPPSSYLSLAEMFPNNIDVLRQLQDNYDKERNWTKAHDTFTKIKSLQEKRNEKNRSELLLNSGRLSRMTESYESATDAYYVLQMGHYETAIKLLTTLIEKDPDSMLNYKNRALAYRKLKKDDLAVKDEKKFEELRKARASETDKQRVARLKQMHPDGYFKSRSFLLFNLYPEAIAEADKELAEQPDGAIPLAVKADAEAKLGRYGEALADYKKVQAKAPKAARIKLDIANMTALAAKGPAPYGDLELLKQSENSKPARNNHRPGAKTILEVAADHKGDYRVYHAIAEALREHSRWPERKAELDKMYAIAPASRNLLFEEIEATQALGKWSETEKYCDTYVNLLSNGDLSGENLEAIEYVFMIRGLARQIQKNYAGAIADDSLALKIDPTSAVLLKDRAACYEKTNKPELARADLAAAGKAAVPD